MSVRSDEEAGFSLIEALIALGIVAAITAAFFQTVGQNALASRGANDRREALLVAQSVIDRAVAGERVTSGRDGELHWQVNRSRSEQSTALDAHPLERVRVTVAGPDGDTLVSLAALRIAG